MRKKLKKMAFFLIPAIVAFLVWFLHFETAARYRAEMEVEVPEISVVIRTLVLDVPTAPADFIYDRDPKSPEIDVPDGLTVTGITEATNAGEYEITFSLDDPDTSEWSDGTTEDKTIIWKILPRSIPIPTATELEHVYTGEVKAPIVSGLDADYAEVRGTDRTTEAGWHTLRFCLKDAVNTRWENDTTADIPVNWLVGVCRIAETLFPSVTEAFETNLSTRLLPVEMLCHWTENAVNADGTDFFSLNGFSLSSDGVTLDNRGELTFLGSGPVRSEGDGNRNHAAVKNNGTLTVEDGVFTAAYSGNATGGSEVYALWNAAGTLTVSAGTFSANGGPLAADAIYLESGNVTVNGGTFNAVNTGAGHGAYVLWMNGGTAAVTDGTFSCSAEAGPAIGYLVAGGTLTLGGGTSTVIGGHGQSPSIAGVSGSGLLQITGGDHSMTGNGDAAGLYASDGGTLEISGGTETVRLTGASTLPANGVLVSGGTFSMSGGSVSLSAEVTGGASGIGISSGTAAVTGGTVTVELNGNARAYGVNSRAGTCTVEHLTMTVQALTGRAYGFIKANAGSLEVRTGQFTVSGDYASTGEANSSASPIVTPTANVNCAFAIQYKTSWSAGTNWSNQPYVSSAVQIRSRGALSTTEVHDGLKTDYGILPVKNGRLSLTYVEYPSDPENGAYREIDLGTFEVKNGDWAVSEEKDVPAGSNASNRLVLKCGEAETDLEETPVQSFSVARGILILSATEEIGHLRSVSRSGFLERLSLNWEEGTSFNGLRSPIPTFETTGFVWVILEESELRIKCGSDRDERLSGLSFELRP